MQHTMKEQKKRKEQTNEKRTYMCKKKIFEYKLKTSFQSLLVKKINEIYAGKL